MSVDNGIGLAESDLRAAVRLEQMGAPIWSDDAVEDARNRVLAQWDRYDGPDEGINRVFLTRLNAWTPGVEAAWKDLSQEGRLSTTRITFDGHAPDAMTLHAVLGTDQVLEWVGSSSFSYTTRDLSPYQNVINAALAGYFGGQSYVELISGYNIAINAMNDMTYSSVAFGTIFDLMDMNAQRER